MTRETRCRLRHESIACVDFIVVNELLHPEIASSAAASIRIHLMKLEKSAGDGRCVVVKLYDLGTAMTLAKLSRFMSAC